jgi:hypothetical protein
LDEESGTFVQREVADDVKFHDKSTYMPWSRSTEELAGLRNAIKLEREEEEEEEGNGNAVEKHVAAISSTEPQNSISQVSYQLRRRPK